ncbi:hypothetical protein ACHAWF_009074 [Thalassiosira exigua]
MNDADDLFGGLPAASNADAGKKDDADDDLFGGLPTASKNAEDAVPVPAPALAGKLRPSGDAGASTDRPAPRSGPSLPLAPAPVRVAGEKRKAAPSAGAGVGGPSGGGGASLVSSLGAAGTAMAFVPHAIRKKKKVAPQPPPKRRAPPAAASSSEAREKAPDDATSEPPTDDGSFRSKDEPPAPPPSSSSASEPHRIREPADDDAAAPNLRDEDPYVENEPESLRLLHASVTDPYDPHVPNDYLAHRERKKTEQVRRDLQRSALQRLDQQERLRKKIEEERRKMLESGDLDRIVESRGGDGGGMGARTEGAGAGRGRGRGRGVANLPAWLLKKQQEQKNTGTAPGGLDVRPAEGGQFDDSHG